MYKCPYKNKSAYHIFTHCKDDYAGNRKEARRIAKKFKKENGCYRIYIMQNWDNTEGIFLEEGYYEGSGSWPN